MSHSIEDQTLALAGVVQAATLVRQLAWEGAAPSSALRASIESLFRFDAPDVPSVYGGPHGVGEGLKALRLQLGGNTRDMEMAGLVIALLILAQRFAANADMLRFVGGELQRIDGEFRRDEGGHSMEDTLFRELDELYRATLSTLEPKIKVSGEQHLLQREDIAARIRATLLAGIRSAVLWRQCGGSRLGLLFRRRKYLEAASDLLRRGMGTV